MKHAEFFKKMAVVMMFNAITLANGQNPMPPYRTAVGLGTGPQSGVTVKHLVKSNAALEGIFSLWPNGPAVTGLYEIYAPTSLRNLNWYYGAGAHASFYTERLYHRPFEGRFSPYLYYADGFGLDAVIGVEYKFPRAPIALSTDLKPFVHFAPDGYIFSGIYPCLGAKITF